MLFKETIEPSSLELLKRLQSTNLLKEFHLAGGTSLALQIGHRISVDLDLFTQNDFETNEMLEFLEDSFNFHLTYSSKNTLKGSIGEVNLDLISHKYTLINKPISIEEIRLLSIPDIAAMKLNAISGNGTRSKDFVDIYFILKQFSLPDIINFYKIKYSNRNQLHVLKSLVFFDEISLFDWPNMVIEKKLTLKQIEKNINSHVKQFNKSI
jgi:hypothetical protein